MSVDDHERYEYVLNYFTCVQEEGVVVGKAGIAPAENDKVRGSQQNGGMTQSCGGLMATHFRFVPTP